LAGSGLAADKFRLRPLKTAGTEADWRASGAREAWQILAVYRIAP
jgi:hypothetical protein